ncbi:MAG: hypothetical protein A3G25_15575 [Betaproteobacteria bacterium RIFCSPLOWO2_12_FULL_63_13]|nr:MAG: hypothetical protein A3G25_15575 [Betaproteobacteria bacterium RIFCSPLOWO2_12_FULL_63_13]
MSCIQLRVHGDISALGDGVSRVVLNTLPVSLRKGDSEKKLALAFRKEFGARLRKLFVSRELCGTLSCCSEELDPLGKDGEKLKGNGMRVFALSGPDVLQKVILSLSIVAYQTMARLVEKEAVDDIRYMEILDAVEAELLRHRY